MTTPSRRGTTRRTSARRRLARIGVLALLMLVACDRGDEGRPEPGPAGPAGTTDAGPAMVDVPARVAGLLAAVDRATTPTTVTLEPQPGVRLELPAREVHPRAPLPPAPADLSLLLPPQDLPPPIGTPIDVSPIPPDDVAIMADGTVFLARNRELLRREGTGTWSRVTGVGALELQADASGTRLLVQAESEVLILGGPDLSAIDRISNAPGGHGQWLGDGELLFIREQVQFAAEHKRRIDLNIYLYDLAEERVRDAGWAAHGRYAAIGTLPAVGLVWGHYARDYQIDPMPAALYALEAGRVTFPLTSTTRAADLSPAADAGGNLLWIRTYRRGTGGGRAFYRPIRSDAPPLQITGRPTRAVAISPTGTTAAVVIATDSGWETRLFEKTAIATERERFDAFALAWEERRTLAEAFQGALRTAFERLPLSAKVTITEFGEELNRGPTEDEVRQQTDAFEEALAEFFPGQRADDRRTALAQLDALFDEIDPFLKEEPALLLGLAGYLARLYREDPGHPYLLDDRDLGLRSRDPVYTNGYSATLLSPYIAARNRLREHASLLAMDDDLHRRRHGSLYVAGVPGDATLQILRGRIAFHRDPLQEVDKTPPDQRDLLALELTTDEARFNNEYDRALLAALLLAEGNPTAPENLRILAKSLMDATYTGAARDVYTAAAALEPRDPYTRLMLGDVHFILSEYDEAGAEYDRALLLDEAKVYSDRVLTRLRMLERRQTAEEATP